MTNRKLVALAGAAMFVVGGSIAWAAIPDSGGVIHGCYDNLSGKLRVADTEDGDPKACGNNETALRWGQQGPSGATGETGSQGPPGISGYETVSEATEFNEDDRKHVTANCPDGKKVIGGGAILVSFSPEQTGIFITDSAPFAETGWFVEAREFFGVGDPWGLQAEAICAFVE
jgi:hypothetical protein